MLFKEFFSFMEKTHDVLHFLEEEIQEEEHASSYLLFHNLDEEGTYILDRTKDNESLILHKQKMRLYFKNLKRFLSSHMDISNPVFLEAFYDTHKELATHCDMMMEISKSGTLFEDLTKEQRKIVYTHVSYFFGYERFDTFDLARLNKFLFGFYKKQGDDLIYNYIKPHLLKSILSIENKIQILFDTAMDISADMLLHHHFSYDYDLEKFRTQWVNFFTYKKEFLYDEYRYFLEEILPIFENIDAGSDLMKMIEDEHFYSLLIGFFVRFPKVFGKSSDTFFSGVSQYKFHRVTLSDVVKHSIDIQIDNIFNKDKEERGPLASLID